MSEKGSLRLAAGMVGGGEGADIGKTHRHAMRLDGHYELVAGVFGQDPEASARMAATARRARRPRLPRLRRDGGSRVRAGRRRRRRHRGHAERQPLRHRERIPAQRHLRRLREAADPGLRDIGRTGRDRRVIRRDSGCATLLLGLRHGPTGRTNGPRRRARRNSVRRRRARVGMGGDATRAHRPQAGAWRTNPEIAGETSVVADLGTHAFHLLRYITGLDATRVSADLSTLVPGQARVRQRRRSG